MWPCFSISPPSVPTTTTYGKTRRRVECGMVTRPLGSAGQSDWRAPSRATRQTAPGRQHSRCARRHRPARAGRALSGGGVASRRTQHRRRCVPRAGPSGRRAAGRPRRKQRRRSVGRRVPRRPRREPCERVAEVDACMRVSARAVDERRGSAGVPLTSRGDGGDRPDRTESTSIGGREVAQPRYTACGARASPSAPNAERRVLQPQRTLRARRGRRLHGTCRRRGSTTAGGDRDSRSV